MTINPHKINVAQSVLDDLNKRLKRTRWTEQEHSVGWQHGTNLDYLKDFTNYWMNEYNWRKEEARLNELSWFTAEFDDKKVNFIHEKGKGPNPTPILLLHGWPDSVMRYTKLIPMLTDPEKFGGNANESFDVIVPLLVGGLRKEPHSPTPGEIRDIAFTTWQLMTEGLGYEKFAAAGGDGGSPMAQIIGVEHPESIIALHLTDIGWHTARRDKSGLSEAEQQYLQNIEFAGFAEGAYVMLQGTKPQTLALALNDSPVGMAAWIIEKFKSWSDCNGDIESVFTKDELITNIMFYWLKNSAQCFSYREEFVSPSIRPDQEVEVPVALAFPPNEMGAAIPPREFAARNLKNIEQWHVLKRGGHFAAMEFPEFLAKDMRGFYKNGLNGNSK